MFNITIFRDPDPYMDATQKICNHHLTTCGYQNVRMERTKEQRGGCRYVNSRYIQNKSICKVNSEFLYLSVSLTCLIKLLEPFPMVHSPRQLTMSNRRKAKVQGFTLKQLFHEFIIWQICII